MLLPLLCRPRYSSPLLLYSGSQASTPSLNPLFCNHRGQSFLRSIIAGDVHARST